MLHLSYLATVCKPSVPETGVLEGMPPFNLLTIIYLLIYLDRFFFLMKTRVVFKLFYFSKPMEPF